MISLGLALLFAALMGLAAERSGLCNVAAVQEIIAERRFGMMLGFFQTIAWVTLAMLILSQLNVSSPEPETLALTPLAIIGGMGFGLGAALNRGCAISTLTKLGSGKVAMLYTIVGFIAGTLAGLLLRTQGLLPQPDISAPLIPETNIATIIGVAVACLIVIIGTQAIAKSRGEALYGAMREGRIGLGWAAILIALANAVIIALIGRFAFTGSLIDALDPVAGSERAPDLAVASLLVALVIGIGVSALAAGRFAVERPSLKSGLQHGIGGTLMGLGASLVPGGNDELLLHSVPGFSPHAIPVWIATMVGIALGILAMQRRSAVKGD